MLHSLEGVLIDLGVSSTAADSALARDFFFRLAQEWPLRLLAPPTSRAFASRLSNLDFYTLLLSLPLSATQILLTRTQSSRQSSRHAPRAVAL
jgi:hypothetical protein